MISLGNPSIALCNQAKIIKSYKIVFNQAHAKNNTKEYL